MNNNSDIDQYELTQIQDLQLRRDEKKSFHSAITPLQGGELACSPLSLQIESITSTMATASPHETQLQIGSNLFVATCDLLQSAWHKNQSFVHLTHNDHSGTRSWLSLGTTSILDLTAITNGFFVASDLQGETKSAGPPTDLVTYKYSAIVLGLPTSVALQRSPEVEFLKAPLDKRKFAILTLGRCLSRETVASRRDEIVNKLAKAEIAAEPLNLSSELTHAERGQNESRWRNSSTSEVSESLTISAKGSMEASATAEVSAAGVGKLSGTTKISTEVGSSVGFQERTSDSREHENKRLAELGRGGKFSQSLIRPANPRARELVNQYRNELRRFGTLHFWDTAQVFLAESEADLRLLIQLYRRRFLSSEFFWVFQLNKVPHWFMSHLPNSPAASPRNESLSIALSDEELASLLLFPRRATELSQVPPSQNEHSVGR